MFHFQHSSIAMVFKIISFSILFLILNLFNCSIFNIFLINLILKQHWKWNYIKFWAFLKKLINQQKVIKFFKKFTAFFPSSSTNTDIRFFLCCDERKKIRNTPPVNQFHPLRESILTTARKKRPANRLSLRDPSSSSCSSSLCFNFMLEIKVL